MKIRFIILSFFLLPLIATWSEAQNKFKLEDFANNGNLTRADIVRYFLQVQYPDLNIKALPNSELTSPVYIKATDGAAIDFASLGLPRDKSVYDIEDVREVLDKNKDRLKLPPDSLTPAAPSTEEFVKLKGVYLREKWQDLKTGDVGDASQDTAAASKAKPATIAFTRNYLTGNDSWTVHGAIFAPIQIGSNWIVVPSATLDKVSNTDPKQSVDSFVFRVAGARDVGDYSQFRIGALYATDTEFRSDQVGGEAEWEIQDTDYGLGAFRGMGVFDKKVLYRGQLFLHAEGGDVINNGGNANLKAGTGFFRVGPYAQLELKPGLNPNDHFQNLLNHLVLTARYQDYEGVNSNVKSTRLFTGIASYVLSDNFSINLTYHDGWVPLSAQRERDFELSLGLLF